MAAALQHALRVDAPKLVSGKRGEFSIWIDGQRVYDKGHDDDFPSDNEAVALVRPHVAAR